jgi:hypothetical protein
MITRRHAIAFRADGDAFGAGRVDAAEELELALDDPPGRLPPQAAPPGSAAVVRGALPD